VEVSIAWFIGLSILGWWLGYLAWHANSNYLGNNQVLSHVSMSMGLLIGWPEIGLHVFTWLEHVIPGYGTDLHAVVLLLSSGFLIMCWIFLPVFWVFLFSDDDGNVALNNFWVGGRSGWRMKRGKAGSGAR